MLYPLEKIPFPNLVLQQVKQWALRSPHAEVCGIIDTHLNVIPLSNISNDPRSFAFNEGEWRAKKEVTKCVFHSHTDTKGLSLKDHKVSFEMSIPYLVYDIQSDTFDYYDPNEIYDLYTRPWNWKRWNCYTLIRDAYKSLYDIDLPIFWMEHSNSAMSRDYTMFLDHFESIGFLGFVPEFNILKPGDVLLMSLGTPNPAHFGLVTGSMLLFQQTRDNIPSLDPLGVDTLMQTYRILKHKDMPV